MIGVMDLLRDNYKKGFTLIEMVVVVAIIALLAGLLTPLLFNYLDDANEAATREEMASIRTAMMSYYEHVNKWPPTWVTDGSAEVFSGLKMLAVTQTTRGYLLPCDSSGKTYAYAAPESGYDPSKGSGWNGPYIAEGQEEGLYRDAWDQKYAYVSYPDYYVVYYDSTSDTPMQGLEGAGYEAVPVRPARVFIASKGRDQKHTDVPPSNTPKMKSEDEIYPDNRDDIILLIAGTDYAKSYWFPLPATQGYM